MMICVVQCTTFGGGGNVVYCASNQTVKRTSQILQFGDAGINIVVSQKQGDITGLALSPFDIVTDFKYHVYTVAYDGLSLKLRRDGIELNNTSAASLIDRQCSINQLCIGDFSPLIATSGHNYFIGNVAMATAHMGKVGGTLDYSIENYLMDYFGI